jgi:hypothetical protein
MPCNTVHPGRLIETTQHLSGLEHTAPPAFVHQTHDACGADGRYRSTSGQEISVSEYTISSEPSEKGFYKFVDVVLETNGLPDCSGNVMPVGDIATNYLRFGDGNNDFLMCREENVRSCFGVARRAPTS